MPTVETQFTHYLEQCRGKAFSWRRWNCVHFAAGWVMEAEHFDACRAHALPVSLAGAVRYVGELGGLVAAVDSALHRDHVPPMQANVGDIVLFDSPGVGGLGVCNGASLVGVCASGLTNLSMQKATHAWRIRYAA